MSSDPWLSPFLSEVHARVGRGCLLELGCGRGVDTAVLSEAGCSVVAIDRSESALTEARARVPAAVFHCQDIRDPFPLGRHGAGVAVASLCLHYFSWPETVAIVERLHDVLVPSGMLLCRLNSTKDRNYGSMGHPQIEKNYYLVNGKPKRFFDQMDVELLFRSGWHIRTQVEEVIHRYEKPKVVWRVIAFAA